MKHHLPLLSLLVTCLTGYSLGFAPSSNLPSLASSSSLARKFHHVAGFASSTAITNSHSAISSSFAFSSASSLLTMGASSNDAGEGADPNETIARRIVVTGDVAGGYYRSCVKNEVCSVVSFCCAVFVYCCCWSFDVAVEWVYVMVPIVLTQPPLR